MADRLYRSRDDRMLAGVAAGVAESLDADPSLIRIAWALLTIFTGGIALVVYIVMAIVVPEAPAGPTTSFPFAGGPVPGEPSRPDPAGVAPLAPGEAPPPVPGEASVPVAPMATAAPAPSYWASDRETRRAARRERRAAGSGRGGLVFGAVLILIGAFFLVRQFVPWFDWNLWWPVGLITLGGLLLVIAFAPGRSSD